MNTTYLKTLLAIRDTGSFLQASHHLNLSHSAVSVQMKRLESHLGRDLFHKGRRPAQLTPFGARFCDRAAPVVADYNRLMRVPGQDSVDGLIRIGFVSTTLQTLLPVVLGALQDSFPNLRVNAVSGLSDGLTDRVAREDLDFAFVSAPTQISGAIRQIDYAREPLRIVAPAGADDPGDALQILATQPFIGFSRTTLLGAQIHASLKDCGVKVNQIVELDSIDAIENLVSLGVGVSVVPQRLFADDLGDRVKTFEFPVPGNFRVLSLISHRGNDRTTVLKRLAQTASARAA